MAAVTVQSSAVLAGIKPDFRQAGVVLCRTGYYKAAAALDANSVVQMVPVPKGAQILDIHMFVGDSGAGRTFDVGDAALVDRFLDGIDPSSGPIRSDYHEDGDMACVENYEYTADDTIDVKWLGDTLEANQTIHMNVFYKMGDTIEDEIAVYTA
jgi:hypothetical protein